MMHDLAFWALSGLGLALVGGYVLGSIPFGLLLTRWAGYGDIRAIGSGNIGATNVLRTGNKKLAAATLLLDGGKGAMAVLALGHIFGPLGGMLAGLGAMLGHTFPVWLRFKGGKGVATALGVLLAMYWPVGVIACLTWLLVALVTRISSLSALIALGTAPAWAWALSNAQLAAVTLGISVLVFMRHKANIIRLFQGEEPRIGARRDKAS